MIISCRTKRNVLNMEGATQNTPALHFFFRSNIDSAKNKANTLLLVEFSDGLLLLRSRWDIYWHRKESIILNTMVALTYNRK